MSTADFNPKEHWENIYAKNGPQEVSWFQAMPKVSLGLFTEYHVPTVSEGFPTPKPGWRW